MLFESEVVGEIVGDVVGVQEGGRRVTATDGVGFALVAS